MVVKRNTPGLLLLMVSMLLLSACGSGSSQTPTPDVNAIYTAAAQTIQVELTRVAALTPSATVTPQPTATQQATATVAVSSTAAATQAAGSSNVPDKGEWVSNTPDDNTVLRPGEEFQIVWNVKNTGTTTWTTEYSYRFFGGDQFHKSATYNLTADVAPNQVAKLVVDAVAPTSEGEYRTNWVLTNNGGTNFYTVYLIIKVQKSSSTSTATTEPTVTLTPTETTTTE